MMMVITQVNRDAISYTNSGDHRAPRNLIEANCGRRDCGVVQRHNKDTSERGRADAF